MMTRLNLTDAAGKASAQEVHTTRKQDTLGCILRSSETHIPKRGRRIRRSDCWQDWEAYIEREQKAAHTSVSVAIRTPGVEQSTSQSLAMEGICWLFVPLSACNLASSFPLAITHPSPFLCPFHWKRTRKQSAIDGSRDGDE